MIQHQVISESPSTSTAHTVAVVAPDSTSMTQIRSYVRTYFELNQQLQKLRVLVRERAAAKNAAADEIIKLMKRFNIEDLNTKDGILRLRESRVKEPLKRADLVERVRDSLVTPHTNSVDDVLQEIFENRPMITKETLQCIIPK